MRIREFSRIAFNEKLLASVCDLDRHASDHLLAGISRRTAIPCACLFRATLRSYEGSLIEKLRKSGSEKWLLPIGVTRGYGERFGIQFCPECLSSDKAPYYRRHWRIAFVTLCDHHHRLLLDRCPHCRSSVNPVRSEVALPFDRLDETLIRCFYCGQDLRDSEDQARVSRRVILRQKSLVRLAERGSGQVFEMDFQYSHLFFNGFFQILQLLLLPRTGRLGEVFRSLSHICFSVKPLPGKKLFRFLMMGVRERHETLDAGYWIMTGWPTNFLKLCNVARIPNSCLLSRFKDAPFWYEKVVKGDLYWNSYKVSREEIESAIRYLEKLGRPVNILEIRGLLGSAGTVKVREVLKGIGYQREDVIPSDPRRWGLRIRQPF